MVLFSLRVKLFLIIFSFPFVLVKSSRTCFVSSVSFPFQKYTFGFCDDAFCFQIVQTVLQLRIVVTKLYSFRGLCLSNELYKQNKDETTHRLSAKPKLHHLVVVFC